MAKTYTVKKGDSFSKIAEKLYGNQRFFNVVQSAFSRIGVGTLQPGMQIRLPDLDTSANAVRQHFVSPDDVAASQINNARVGYQGQQIEFAPNTAPSGLYQYLGERYGLNFPGGGGSGTSTTASPRQPAGQAGGVTGYMSPEEREQMLAGQQVSGYMSPEERERMLAQKPTSRGQVTQYLERPAGPVVRLTGDTTGRPADETQTPGGRVPFGSARPGAPGWSPPAAQEPVVTAQPMSFGPLTQPQNNYAVGNTQQTGGRAAPVSQNIVPAGYERFATSGTFPGYAPPTPYTPARVAGGGGAARQRAAEQPVNIADLNIPGRNYRGSAPLNAAKQTVAAMIEAGMSVPQELLNRAAGFTGATPDDVLAAVPPEDRYWSESGLRRLEIIGWLRRKEGGTTGAGPSSLYQVPQTSYGDYRRYRRGGSYPRPSYGGGTPFSFPTRSAPGSNDLVMRTLARRPNNVVRQQQRQNFRPGFGLVSWSI